MNAATVIAIIVIAAILFFAVARTQSHVRGTDRTEPAAETWNSTI